MQNDYYVGFDLGTSSVGWAVTDTSYHIIRKKGADLWGIREFDEANNAQERRTNRISRRRYLRETARIQILNFFFTDEINKIDHNFFKRLQESKFYLEDKIVNNKYVLFADPHYTDADYFKDYPTIFHLRKALITSESAYDIRLLYLALLNMFQHRGHFLNDISFHEDGNVLSELYQDLLEKTEYISDETHFPDTENATDTLLSKSGSTKSAAVSEIADSFGISSKKDKVHYEILKAIYGMKFKPSILFGAEIFPDTVVKESLSFRDNLDEKISELENLLSAEQMELFYLIQTIHNNIYLSGIMHGHRYLSFARVESYEKHKADLALLKSCIKQHCPEQYNAFFRDMTKDSYSAYIGSVNSGGTKQRRGLTCKTEDFYKNIRNILKNVPDGKEKTYILQEIEKENFLPKQLTLANGVIPNQVHLAEMKAILQRAENYFAFLKETDKTGLTVSQKIIRIFSFHIPYYVGPLCNTPENKGWVVRKESGKVLPWNFEQKIDIKQSAEKFIENLINTCTYFSGEKVLPKHSLLYEKYMVLNELNNLKIDDTKISVSLKQDIYNSLFLKGKKVTRKQLIKYLIGKGVIKDEQENTISGIDLEFKNHLSSYGKFSPIFPETISQPETLEMMENIIFWGTVYGDDKKFYAETIQEHYGEVLKPAQQKRIFGLKFKDWGNFSKQFLLCTGCSKEDGKVLPFIEMMWETNQNHMELLSDRYTYMDQIKEKQQEIEKTLTTFTYEDLDDLYASAPVKRMTWQAILLLKEIVAVMGREPKRVFIEMPRGEEEKGDRKDSRKKQVELLYKSIKHDKDIQALSQELSEKTDADMRQKKIYLYFIQKGRCMYTGEPIHFADLMADNLYDIDHIYPRHFIKDDSIHNNLVLVKKQVNAHKSDHYPIEDAIYNKQYAFWRTLKDQKLITEEKYKRLTNRCPFTEEQLAGFISRQIVETGQATKTVAQLLKTILQESTIVYVKAGIVSQFRTKFILPKSRKINDFHHAQDAYLNIVAGNIYYVKFTNNTLNFVKNYQRDPENHKYHMDKVFDFSVERNGEIAWDVTGERSMFHTVLYTVYKTTPILTRMCVEGKGQLYNATLYGKAAVQKSKSADISYFPLKTSDARLRDIEKYGGYTSITGAYFFLVEHEVKGKKVRTLETMPLYLKSKIEADSSTLQSYCENELGLLHPSIRIPKIKMQSLLKINGYFVYISGRTGNQIILRNAVSLCLSKEWTAYIKKLENTEQKGYLEKEITAEKNAQLYQILTEKHQNSIFAKRPNAVGEKLAARFDKFCTLTLEDQCTVLMQILQLSAPGIKTVANLKLIDESANAGIMLINKKISELKECVIIHQSPAGLYERKVDLLQI